MDPIEETGSHQSREKVGTESDSLEPADTAEAIGVTKRRQRTEKGKEFIAHIRWTDCQSITRRVRRQIKEIDSLATSEENMVVPSFADFVNFVNAEAGIATNPVFSREALRRLEGYSDRPDRSGKGKGFGKSKTSGGHNRNSHQASNHATEVTGQGTSKATSLCKFCNKGHDLDDCQDYLKKTLSQRKEFIKGEALCFACYNPGHRAHGCAQQRTCKSCSRRHPTGLHDDNFALNQEASKQQIPPPPQQKDHASNSHMR